MTDMDFAAYTTQRQEIEKALEHELGYKIWRPALTPTLTRNRIIFYKPSENRNLRLHEMDVKGDVFLDELCMNHTIKWIGS
jgi:hypothetical protein